MVGNARHEYEQAKDLVGLLSAVVPGVLPSQSLVQQLRALQQAQFADFSKDQLVEWKTTKVITFEMH